MKAAEYAAVPGIQVYVMLESERPEMSVRRRSTGWDEEVFASLDAEVPLPEIGVTLPLAAIYSR